VKPVEYGDFQTPALLAKRMVRLIQSLTHAPKSILEPTCGIGNLLEAALEVCTVERALGIELQSEYAVHANSRFDGRAEVRNADFFTLDLNGLFLGLPEPRLIIGNPPWVTNAAIGVVSGSNLPEKVNTQGLRGLEARTGKSNFDISEAILLRLLERVQGTSDTLIVIVKTSVARKLLRHAVQREWRIRNAAIYAIDAKRDFGAAVDASVFVCEGTKGNPDYACRVFSSLETVTPERSISFDGDTIIADADTYARAKIFLGGGRLEWRSGIKHDCSGVMEFRLMEDGLENGLGERIELEGTCLYPMLKSSDLGNDRTTPRGWMLVPQTFIGEPTERLRTFAPRTWAYLEKHTEKLNARGSSIYKNQPQFAIFGVGAYSFALWKVAVSGLYKRVSFALVPPFQGRPIVLDDTCYFLPCDNEAQARVLHAILNSPEAKAALNAIVFWDEKRPITKDRLGQIAIHELAKHLEGTLLNALLENATNSAQLKREWHALTERADELVSLFA
jgi:hypothetical protein